MHFAAYSGHTAVLRLLLEHGALVNALCKPTKFGETGPVTPLRAAGGRGHNEAAELLIESGAKIINPDYLEKRFIDKIMKSLSWTPERHHLFSQAIQARIEVLHVAWGQKADGTNSHPESPLSTLPLELIFEIAGFVAATETQPK